MLPIITINSGGNKYPFFFTFTFLFGTVLGRGLWIYKKYGYVVSKKENIEIIKSHMKKCNFFWSCISAFTLVFFSFSLRFMDASGAAVIYESWPLIFVLLMSFQFRDIDNRYNKISGRQIFLILYAFAGLICVILSQNSREIERLAIGQYNITFGIILSLAGAITTSFQSFQYKWAYDIQEEMKKNCDYINEINVKKYNEDTLEFASLQIIRSLVNTVGAIVTLILSLLLPSNLGGGVNLSMNELSWSFVGGMSFILASMSAHKANLLTRNLAINSLRYLIPALSLGFLILYSLVFNRQDIVDIRSERLLIIGILSLVSANILINFQYDKRLNLPSLVLAIWFSGIVVYLRSGIFDNSYESKNYFWSGSDYFASLGVSATIFSLILAFRMNKISEQAAREEDLTYGLFQKIKSMSRKKTLNSNALQELLLIDAARRPEDIKVHYGNLSQALKYAFVSSSQDKSNVDEVQKKLDNLVRSKGNRSDLGENLSIIGLAILSISISLFARPNAQDFGLFFLDIFSIIFSSSLVFLAFNLFDLKNIKAENFISNNLYEGTIFYAPYVHQACQFTKPEKYHEFGAKFEHDQNNLLQRNISLSIIAVMLVAFIMILV